MTYRPWLVVSILLLSNQIAQAQSSSTTNAAPAKPAPSAPAPATSTTKTATSPAKPAAPPAPGAAQPPRAATIVPRIAVKVDAPAEMKKTIELYMKKELANAVHYPAVDKDEQWQIQIVAFDPDSKPHAERFSMAVAFVQKTPHVDPMIIVDLRRNHCLPDPTLKNYEKGVEDMSVFESLSAWDGRIGELQKTCQSIAVAFNKVILVPAMKGLASGDRKVFKTEEVTATPAHNQVPDTKLYEPPPIPLPKH